MFFLIPMFLFPSGKFLTKLNDVTYIFLKQNNFKGFEKDMQIHQKVKGSDSHNRQGEKLGFMEVFFDARKIGWGWTPPEIKGKFSFFFFFKVIAC